MSREGNREGVHVEDRAQQAWGSSQPPEPWRGGIADQRARATEPKGS